MLANGLAHRRFAGLVVFGRAISRQNVRVQRMLGGYKAIKTYFRVILPILKALKTDQTFFFLLTFPAFSIFNLVHITFSAASAQL